MAGDGAARDEARDHAAPVASDAPVAPSWSTYRRGGDGSWPTYGDRPDDVSGVGDHVPAAAARRPRGLVAGLVAAAVVIAAGGLALSHQDSPSPAQTPTPAASAPVQAAAASAPQWTRAPASLTAGLVRVTVTATVEADGIVLTSDGVVATSYARLVGLNGGASAINDVELRVVADGGMPMRATIIGFDASRDVAVLRVPGYTPSSVARLGKPVAKGDRLTVLDDQGGDQPIVGFPVAVSAVAQRCSRVGAEMIGHPKGFQFGLDLATAEPGGALVRADGTVAGMYFGGDDSPRCAVPIADVAEIVRNVVLGRQTATTRVGPPGGLGVQLYAAHGGYPQVVGIDAFGSQANGAGVQLFDVLTKVDGTSLRGSDLGALGPDGFVRSLEPGQKVTLEWRSGRKTHRATVTVGVGAQPNG